LSNEKTAAIDATTEDKTKTFAQCEKCQRSGWMPKINCDTFSEPIQTRLFQTIRGIFCEKCV